MIKTITRDKGGHFIMTKRSIHQEYIMIINGCMQKYNNRVPKYMKEKPENFNKKQIIQQLLLKT